MFEAGLNFFPPQLANAMPDPLLKDPKVIPHLAHILNLISKTNTEGDLRHLSNLAKQTQPKLHNFKNKLFENPISLSSHGSGPKDYYVGRFSDESRRLEWAGFGLPKQEVLLIEGHLRVIAEKNNARQVRFWGKILGSQQDYYIIQGVTAPIAALEEVEKGAQKRGEGANYYTFWVSSNLLNKEWTELPLITPQHIKTARKIKIRFSGILNIPVISYPPFEGEERHYLKAQLVRMTSSLQLVPKGIYKPNDDNPKVVQFEDEPKVPEFAELAGIQTWVHRNLNLLHLGRCTHYIDPSTPEDQLEALTSELTQKDPQLQRLRAITEDKLPEGNPYGVQIAWQIRTVGNSQVFQKDQASNVYATVVLKNLHWPGWVTVGYKGGFTNYYTGYGHKSTQPAWSHYENANLAEEAQQLTQFREPNPKDEPVPPPPEAAPEQPPEQ